MSPSSGSRSSDPPATPVPRVEGLPTGDFDSTDDHTAIYLTMLDAPSVSRDELVLRGFPADYVHRVMRTFVNRGLARTIGDDVWEALPPDVALPAFAARLEEYASTIRASTASLTRTYAARIGEKPDPSGYDRLAGVEEIAAATSEVIALAGEEVSGVRNASGFGRYLLGLPMAAHEKPLVNQRGRHLKLRMTYETSVLHGENVRAVLRARERTGAQHRYLSYLPFSAIVTDRGMAVVDIDGPGGEVYGLLISTPEAAQAIVNVAEWAWRLGSPWLVGADDESHGLDPRDRRILEQLAIGTTDSTIARRLGVSQRTVERRVRELMHRLGAETRFQAGVLAAKDGLI